MIGDVASRILQLFDSDQARAIQVAQEYGEPLTELRSALANGRSADTDLIIMTASAFKLSAAYVACLPNTEPGLSLAMRTGLAKATAPADAVECAEYMIRISATLASWLGEAPDKLAGLRLNKHQLATEAGKRTAENVRMVLGLGDDALPDMVDFVESTGTPVSSRPMPTEVLGFNARQLVGEKHRRAIVVNSAMSWTNQRFTLAHELSHSLFNDADPLIVSLSEDIEDQAPDLKEIRANRFARHLLLPAPALANRVEAARESNVGPDKLVPQLMLEFGISKDVILRALSDDGHLALDSGRSRKLSSTSVFELMKGADLTEQWELMCTEENTPSGSPLLVDRAVTAYGYGFVHQRVIARLMDRGEDEVLAELKAAGWPDPGQ